MPTNSREILITGCSSGIGLGCALGLAERGYRVFASARRPADVDMLRDKGLEAVQLDLDSDESIGAALDTVYGKTGGKLYALFNNGAYGQPGAVEDLTRDVLRAQLETNLLGTHELTRRVLPGMIGSGEGRVVQNSSVLGFVALRNRGAYVCSKFALEGLTDTLRQELRGTGVRVSLIQPGPIASRFRENALAKFSTNIEHQTSRHHARYERELERLNNPGPVSPYTLQPEAVLRRLVHALESPRPRIRYRVTKLTHYAALFKWLVTDRQMDRFLRRF